MLLNKIENTMNRLSSIVFVSILHFSGMTIAQKKCDYQLHALLILEQAIYDILLEDKYDFDSIHVQSYKHLIFVLNENSTSEEWRTEGFTIKLQGKSRIKSISTECVLAMFKYDIFGKLKRIRYKYSIPLNDSFSEGTILCADFRYQGDLLDEIFGGSSKYKITFFD